MATFANKTLVVSFIILWLSVTFKHESSAFLSRSGNSNSGSSNSGSSSSNSGSSRSSSGTSSRTSDSSRVREAIRHKIHGDGDARIRDALKDKFHRVEEKFHKDKPAKPSDSSGGAIKPPIPSGGNVQPKVPPYPQQPSYPNPPPYPQQPQFPQPSGGAVGGGGYYNKPYQPQHGGGVYGDGGYPPYSGSGSSKSSKFSKLAGVAKKILMSSRSRPKNQYKHNYVGGFYNDYNYRPDRYSQIQGQVCRNFLEYEGIVFGEFVCPIEGNNYDETECCGDPNEQYCCTSQERAIMRGEQWTGGQPTDREEQGLNAILIFFTIFIPVFLISIILCGVCIFFCYKKRIYEKVPGLAS